jgi:hypothetical protein
MGAPPHCGFYLSVAPGPVAFVIARLRRALYVFLFFIHALSPHSVEQWEQHLQSRSLAVSGHTDNINIHSCSSAASRSAQEGQRFFGAFSLLVLIPIPSRSDGGLRRDA